MLRAVLFLALAGCSFMVADQLNFPPDGGEGEVVDEPDAEVIVEEPDAGPPVEIQCGQETCFGAVCCVQERGHNEVIFSCREDGNCPGNAHTYRCDGPEDCPEGQGCCPSDSGSLCCQ